MLPLLLGGCSEDDETEKVELIAIRLSEENISIDAGESFQFEAITVPADYPQDDFVWNVVMEDGGGKGFIDKTGLFTASQPGKVYVEVLSHEMGEGPDKPLWANTVVTIIGESNPDIDKPDNEKPSITDIVFDRSSVSMETGETAAVDFIIYPSNADASTVSWNVADNSIVSITSTSGQIRITAKKVGSTEIYAVVNGKRYSVNVTVYPVEIERVYLDKDNLTVKVGDTFQLNATISPTNADRNTLVYESSDTDVATVSSDGKVSAVGTGSCRITVSNENKTVSDYCDVRVVGSSIEEQIAVSVYGSFSSINGYTTADATAVFRNNSDKEVYIKSFKLYDTSSNRVVMQKDDCGTLEGGKQLSLNMQFRMVYRPLYVWEYKCEGKTYEVSYQDD